MAPQPPTAKPCSSTRSTGHRRIDLFLPFSTWDRALTIGVSFNQAGIDCEALTADHAWRSTSEWKTPRCSRRRVSVAKKVSTALAQEQEVGVKWNVQRGWRASQARTLGCLWAA